VNDTDKLKALRDLNHQLSWFGYGSLELTHLEPLRREVRQNVLKLAKKEDKKDWQ